jgi:hypothetical protein
MKSTGSILCAAICAFVVTALPTAANAQDKSRSEGFFVGGGFEGTGISIEDDDDTESGSGFGLTVGYGFTPRLSIYGHFSGGSVDDTTGGEYSIGHFDIGTRVHFRAPANTVVPFIQAGLSSRALQQDFDSDEIEASGFGVAVGGGINAHFKPALAFTASATWSIGNVGNFKVNGTSIDEVDSSGMTTARIHVGITWFPQSK